MADHITWTQREWRAVEAALPYYWHTPTPAELDAAQRATLDPDRWRPIVSFYGRINQAQYLYELRGARILNHAEALQRRIRLAALMVRLEEVKVQLAAAIKADRTIPTMRAPDLGPAEVGAACRIQFDAPATPARVHRRIDVVGLIGMQRERALEKLREYPTVAENVRFVDVDNARRVDVTDTHAAVLVTRFISHVVEDRYAKKPVFRISRPSAQRIVAAVLDAWGAAGAQQ